VVCGDGGFMLGGLTEFITAVRLGLDLTVVVVNDGAFGAEHIQLVRKGIDPSISTFEWPDLAEVARSLGGQGVTVGSIDELDATLARLGRSSGPTLVNILVSADELSAVG
jgi:thiamine pyrophosphate-dependent acetolactate synthase large subunit-like protein